MAKTSNMEYEEGQVGIFTKSGSLVRFLEVSGPVRRGEARLLHVARLDTGKEMLITPAAFVADVRQSCERLV